MKKTQQGYNRHRLKRSEVYEHEREKEHPVVALAMGGDFSTQNPGFSTQKVENPVKTTCPIWFCFGVGEREMFRNVVECHVKGKNALGLGPFYGAVKCDNNDNNIT